MAALVTTIALDSNGLSFIFEPTIAGKEPRVFGMKMDLEFFDQTDLYLMIPLALFDGWNLRLCTYRWSYESLQ